MNNVIVYSKNNCAYCTKAKAYLSMKGVAYNEVRLGEDIMVEDFKSLFPTVQSVPFIMIDGEQINGFDDLVEWIDNRPQFLAG